MKPRKYRIALVTWIDSSMQHVQVGKEDFPKPALIRSVGFVAGESSTSLTLARDDMKHDEYRGLLCIPRECIRDVEEF